MPSSQLHSCYVSNDQVPTWPLTVTMVFSAFVALKSVWGIAAARATVAIVLLVAFVASLPALNGLSEINSEWKNRT